MRTTQLDADAILSAYRELSILYPHILPLILWRGWELAAYRRLKLVEPVLDVGCGDGQFFRLAWPAVREVDGIDHDPGVAELARQSGVYRHVYVSPAHELAAPAEAFGSAFANCSLEHMDHLDRVLAGVHRSLRPGGNFVLSVVTDKFVTWALLPKLLDRLGAPERGQSLAAEHIRYHHLANPLPAPEWVRALENADFEVEEHIPIVPEVTGRMFLLLDQLWHAPSRDGELGAELHAALSVVAGGGEGWPKAFAGLLELEQDWSTGCGAVFSARRA